MMQSEAEQLAQRQLDAYNSRDIDAFAACYAEDVQLMRLGTGEVFCAGREQLHTQYGAMFASHPNLHCQLVKRIVCGEFAYDEEEVQGLAESGVVHAVACYQVQNGLIQKAWFVRG